MNKFLQQILNMCLPVIIANKELLRRTDQETVGDFTFWISLSLSLKTQSKD